MSSPPGAGPFGALLGARLVKAEDGSAEVSFDARPDHANEFGVLHGGVQMALLDMAMGAAVVSTLAPATVCASVTINTDFLRAGAAGRLAARGRVTRRGRTLAFVEGTLEDAEGRSVSRASGIWAIRG